MRIWRRIWERLATPEFNAAAFGLSARDRTASLRRFRWCRCRATAWRPPTDGERLVIDGHPVLTRYGDRTVAVAETDGCLWIVRERDWSGFPDPPQYAFFLVQGDVIRAGHDFDNWPRLWIWPGGVAR